jgi:phosphoribosyl-ATP pyrophosphohydrolase
MNNEGVLFDLYDVILDRKINPIEGSYTNYLFEKGLDKILKKFGEESIEVIIASKNSNPEEITNEICDLMYHLFVLMAESNVSMEMVFSELSERRKKLGNKKAERKEIENL